MASRPSPTTSVIFGLGYALIFFFGLLGNVLTLYVLLCKGRRCTVQDILIANLACSDIMLCVFAVPITPKYMMLDGHWTLGYTMCKIVSFAQSTSVYMSTYSLICIGYIRYRLILHPLEESMSKRTALVTCLGTWAVGILVTLPYMLQVRLRPEHCEIKFCDEAWAKQYRFVFSLFTASFQFMIPLCSVGFFNRKIYSRLDGRRSKQEHHQQQLVCGRPTATTTLVVPSKQQAPAANHHEAAAADANNHQHHDSNNNLAAPCQRMDVIAMKEQRRREKESRMRKANNRLILVVIFFAHSWLPLNLFNIAQDSLEEMSQWPYLTTSFLIVHQIACSSVCWNPVLYAWMSETYRQDLRNALPRFVVRRFHCLWDRDHQRGKGALSLAHNRPTPSAGSTRYLTIVTQQQSHVHSAEPAELAEHLEQQLEAERELSDIISAATADLANND